MAKKLKGVHEVSTEYIRAIVEAIKERVRRDKARTAAAGKALHSAEEKRTTDKKKVRAAKGGKRRKSPREP